jgi:hypothetical protein
MNHHMDAIDPTEALESGKTNKHADHLEITARYRCRCFSTEDRLVWLLVDAMRASKDECDAKNENK